jgi:hypothetical protein
VAAGTEGPARQRAREQGGAPPSSGPDAAAPGGPSPAPVWRRQAAGV